MHPDFLNILCCPKTKQPLELDPSEIDKYGMVIRGKLSSQDGKVYPIIDRIPRFVSQEHYSSSFGYEWNRWPRVQFEDENIGKPMAGHTTRMWRSITGITPEQVSGKTIVDFGCGPGRFLDVVRRAGGKAVGIDLSLSVQAARRNFANDPDVLIVQGDVLNPPFRSSVFDGGYTIGVLHHTPDPQKGVQTLVDSIMPRGWVACSVYGKGGFYDSPAVARFRKLNQKLKPVLKYRPALAYSYFSAYVLTPILRGVQIPLWGPLVKYLRNNWLVCLNIPDKRWRILDTFDAITPSIASTHTYEEVIQWMENAGCSDVRRMDFGGVSLSGVKS